MRKEALLLDAWPKEVAPSTELRKWFCHGVDRWVEFQRRYRRELSAHRDVWLPILEASRRGPVTLVYSAHDPEHNAAVVLRDYLTRRTLKTAARRKPGAVARKH